MLESFLVAAVIAGTPLLLAIIGEILTEKVGNLNLGVEGLMLIGAVIGFNTALNTQNPYSAFFAAALAGVFGALIYAFLTVSLKTNQVVTGLSLTIFGSGFAGFLGKKLVGEVVPENVSQFFVNRPIPFLSEIPYLGNIVFNHSLFVYFAYLSAIIVGIYLFKTKYGLNLRAIGENTAAGDVAGLDINLYKYIHISLGGLFCALGGAYLSLVYVPAWQENVTAGRGWIAVALVIFCRWNPYLAVLAAFFFGGLDIIGFRLQAFNLNISRYLIDMLPYLFTTLVLVIGSVRKSKENNPPQSLGQAYFREER